MTKDEALKLALDALEEGYQTHTPEFKKALTAMRKALAQPQQEPEFFAHNVNQPYDWSEWVCPDPDDYLIKCCDCGLVHQAQFRVAKYAPAPSEECEIVNDPDLQAQFRMRRHAVTKPQPDNWTPEDTAHRAGGLEQPEQKPVAYDKTELNFFAQDLYDQKMREGKRGHYESMFHVIHQCVKKVASPPAQRKPLTEEEIWKLAANCLDSVVGRMQFARAIEAAHGIKENT